MKTLYLVRGLPGSGKSTLAKALLCLPNSYHVEADQWFVNNGVYTFDRNELCNAHTWCQDRTEMLLQSTDVNVVVSNTSTTENEVQVYKNIAERKGANFVSLILENRHNNSSIHDVPKETLAKMKQRFGVKL